MDELDLYNLKMHFYETSLPPTSLIQRAISTYEPEDAMVLFFTKCKSVQREGLTFRERFQYGLDLAQRVRDLSGFDYSDDDVAIYALYTTPVLYCDRSNDEVSLKTLNQLEKVFDLKASGENEEFAQENVKYKILHFYSEFIHKGKYEDMKKLLASLNETKAIYEQRQATILDKA